MPCRQGLIRQFERHQRLRMQRRGHVDALVIAIGTFETDVFRGRIGPDPLEQFAEGGAGPFADHVPALDTDMPGDLGGLRQSIKLLNRPRPLVLDLPSQGQAVIAGGQFRGFVGVVPGVVAKVLHRLGFRERRCQLVGPEDRRLHPVVEARHQGQSALHAVVVADVATGQHRQGADRQTAAQQAAAFQILGFHVHVSGLPYGWLCRVSSPRRFSGPK